MPNDGLTIRFFRYKNIVLKYMRKAMTPHFLEMIDKHGNEAFRFTNCRSYRPDLGNTELRFVYGVCGTASPFDGLHHIMDAGQVPLEDLGEAEFRHAYGLSRRLRFEDAAPRARTTSDWWSTVYE